MQYFLDAVRFRLPIYLPDSEVVQAQSPAVSATQDLSNAALVVLAGNGENDSSPLKVAKRLREAKRPAFKSLKAWLGLVLLRGDTAPEGIVYIDDDELYHVHLANRLVHRQDFCPLVSHVLRDLRLQIRRGAAGPLHPFLVI